MQVDFNKYNLDETVENYLIISMFESIIETNETHKNSKGKGNPYRDTKSGRFTTGPGGASSSVSSNRRLSENKLDDLISEYEGDSYEPGARNELMAQVSKELGYDEKPKMIDGDEFAQLKEEGHIELYRGYSDQQKSAKEYMREFREGELWAGNGHYGAGTYTFPDRDMTMGYTGGKFDDNVQAMSLSKDAKIAKYQDHYREFNSFREKKYNDFMTKSESAYMAGDDTLGETYDTMSEKYGSLDFGVYMAYKGYDAYTCAKDDNDPREIFVVLNRGKITVPKEYS